MSDTIFRPYSSSDSLRSDRSATDRQRHRQKVREAVRDNIADLIAEESIIGKNKDKIIKVPIRGMKEYRFIYGNGTQKEVGAGGKHHLKRGQKISRRAANKKEGEGKEHGSVHGRPVPRRHRRSGAWGAARHRVVLG